MRTVDLSLPAREHTSRTARLTRHLEARLLDFGPGGPEVLAASPEQGRITVRFPGHDTAEVLDGLKAKGILACSAEKNAVFYLADNVSFEDLDYVWGCLFELL